MNKLVNSYLTHKGKITDRWLSYMDHYDRWFASMLNRPIRLLEIGIQNGGSLEIWSKFFPNATIIVGCDIDPLCKNLKYDDPRISVVVGDASSNDTIAQIDKISDCWDIVIDDGSHHSRHIIDSFARFFPKISDDGMYIAEDLHCNYWSEFDSGLINPFSAIGLFKRFADLLNFDHWGIGLTRSEYLNDFETCFGNQFNEDSLATIHSVEFLNSICMIRKRPAKLNILGPRLVVGTEEQITQGATQYNNTLSEVHNQSKNPLSAVKFFNSSLLQKYSLEYHSSEQWLCDILNLITQQKEQIIDLERNVEKSYEDIKELNKNIVVSDKKIVEFKEQLEKQTIEITELYDKQINEIAELHFKISTLNNLVAARENQITDFIIMQNRLAARYVRFIERIANKMFPVGRRRRLLVIKILKILESIYKHGIIGTFRHHRIAKIQNETNQDKNTDNYENNFSGLPAEFDNWIKANEPTAEALLQQRKTSPSYNKKRPLFSIIAPIYKIPSSILAATIQSVQQQTWQDWELCIAYADIDNHENLKLLKRFSSADHRIKIKRLSTNGGISRNSNAALEIACGDFIALLDHDDMLTPWALHDMAEAINKSPEADFLYSDKDTINASGTVRTNALFKPQWSPEMLYSVNYLTHFNVMRRSIVTEIGGWNPETDGAQDWDIFLRVAELSRQIIRVPRIHYHWRIIEGSTATNISAKPYAFLGQLRTLELRIKRLGLSATVKSNPICGYQLFWPKSKSPEIDVILHRGNGSNPMPLIESVIKQLNGQLASISVIISSEEELLPPLNLPNNIKFYTIRGTPNETSSLVQAISKTDAKGIILLDRDIIELSDNSLQDISGWVLNHPDIGFASALILANNNTIVEAGLIVGENYQSLPLYNGLPTTHTGLLGGPLWYRNISAASPTALAFKRNLFNISKYTFLPLNKAIIACCKYIQQQGKRGLLSPHVQVKISKIPSSNIDLGWHDSMRYDPYFHPSLRAVSPPTLYTKS